MSTLADLIWDESPDQDVPWPALVTLARRHGVSPLLFWSLKKRQPAGVRWGSDAMRALQVDYHTAAARALLREQAFAEALEALDKAEVPAIVLKGAALAHKVYPDPTLRQMGDLDLLVRHQRLDRAREALERLGYQYRPEPPRRFNPFNTEFTGEMSFLRTRDGQSTLVELHWELSTIELIRRTAALDLEALWDRAVPFRMGSLNALSLALEDALAHVCLHLSMHGFAHWRGYPDIVQMTTKGQIDWDAFTDRVRQARIRTACYFPLWWAKRVWGAPVPKEVLASLQPGPVRVWLGRWMTRQGAIRKANVGHAWNHVAQMVVVDRVRDMIRVLLWLLFPGRTWLRERYRLQSTWRVWAFTFLHPLIVVWEGLQSLGALVSQASDG